MWKPIDIGSHALQHVEDIVLICCFGVEVLANEEYEQQQEYELIQAGKVNPRQPKNKHKDWGKSFHRATLFYAPENWTYVVLKANGKLMIGQ